MTSTPPQSSISSLSWSSWSSPSSIFSHEPLVRVAVVGGGLAGLTLGQLLHNAPNIQVTVYERSAESVDRLCGYRVMLSYFVLQKLQATLRKEVWARIASSIGVSPKAGQELAFMKRLHLFNVNLSSRLTIIAMVKNSLHLTPMKCETRFRCLAGLFERLFFTRATAL
jgi:hypothetical protein